MRRSAGLGWRYRMGVMSEEKKVEQDERGAFERYYFGRSYAGTWNAVRDGEYIVERVSDAWKAWQARAALTSANVDRFDPYRLKVAEECCERLMSACTDAGCPDGVRMDDWIRENIRSTSANVAQDESQVRGRMRLKVEKLAGALTEAEKTKSDIIGDDGEQVTGVRVGWGAWALLRAAIIDLIEYKCESDSALADAHSSNVEQGKEAVGYYLEYGSGRYDVIPAWATADKNQALLVKQRGSPVYRVAPPAQTALTDEQITDIRRAAVLIRENSYPFPDKPHSNWALADRIDKIISGDKS